MRRNQVLALALAFTIALFAIGIPYWQIPYAKAKLPNAIVGFGLVVVFAAAALVRWFGRVSFRRSFLVVGLAAPCAVAVRVFAGVSMDPTSHNLWPFELVLAGAVGFAASLCGTLLGSGLSLLSRRRDGP